MLLAWRDVRLNGGPPISTSVTEAETVELQRLAAGGRVLEVGAAFGYSTVALAQTAAWVTSVDPHEWLSSYDTHQLNLRAYGVTDRVGVWRTTSYDALPQAVADGRTYDLVFIDGDHAEAAVEHDAAWGVKLLAAGGVLACHDWDEDTCPGVRAALERLLGQPSRLVDTLAVYEDLAS